MEKLYLACRRIKFEKKDREKMNYRLFKDKEEAINFIIDSVMDNIIDEFREGEIESTIKELREKYDKTGLLTYGSSIDDDDGNWTDFDVEYYIEDLELLSQRPQHTFLGPNPWDNSGGLLQFMSDCQPSKA